ncbi:uncharacterized protein LOC121397049 [Xenopus laevis]|uniref:Uncharacterized protein LOC121397049 n=1 Tax=Xenopus laevis TaxID=8355 RepID=A0A8J1LIC0_XENLA|nr:uncharacterized protein LOC121397049 [Xenopus laevis]
MAEGKSVGLFTRAGRKGSLTAQVTYLACSVCQQKIPGGQGEPLCRSCNKGQGETTASGGLPAEATGVTVMSQEDLGAAAEPPAPLWAVQLSQSLAALQGLPAIAENLGKTLVRLNHRTSGKRRRMEDASVDVRNPNASDDSSPELLSSQSEGEIESPGSVSADEEEIQDEGKDRDSLHDIDGIIKGVLEVLNISQKPKHTAEASNLFKRQHKSSVCFPENDQLQSLIQNEWDSPEHKFQTNKKFNKLYPFPKELVNVWSNPPVVDAPVSRLSKSTTLPVTDAAAFKDSSDRRLEGFLRAVYSSAGSTLRPCLASAWVSRAVQAWSEALVKDIQSGTSSRQELLESAQAIAEASSYLCDATLDTSQVTARTSALSVAARRTLWLKNWSADVSSKKSLTSLPFKGQRLFGEELE